MNPNTKIHAAVKLNGDVIQWGETELKYIPMKLAKLIVETDLSAQQFSTLELRLAKRPIVVWSADPDSQWLESLTTNTDTENDPIDSMGDITHRELAELQGDPIWSNRLTLSINPENYDLDAAGQVMDQWTARYGNTKFARLMK